MAEMKEPDASRPTNCIISEELVAAGCIPKIGERFVLVDPLDGTREFIAGRPEVTVNIALVENGRPTAGAVYAPLMGRLWVGGTEARVIDGPRFFGLRDRARAS
ncbi:MAG TPA: inositol monophosphatase family protein [Beijerinckiaceae bacterium]|nr:inositol monophosphatase family protein [Beijerinckiaceae bacterium]